MSIRQAKRSKLFDYHEPPRTTKLDDDRLLVHQSVCRQPGTASDIALRSGLSLEFVEACLAHGSKVVRDGKSVHASPALYVKTDDDDPVYSQAPVRGRYGKMCSIATHRIVQVYGAIINRS